MISLPVAVASAGVLAEDMDQDTRNTLINNALPIAGLFVVLLLIAVYLLWRSMNKQMKKINPELPAGPDDRLQARDRLLTKEAVQRGEQADDRPTS